MNEANTSVFFAPRQRNEHPKQRASHKHSNARRHVHERRLKRVQSEADRRRSLCKIDDRHVGQEHRKTCDEHHEVNFKNVAGSGQLKADEEVDYLCSRRYLKHFEAVFLLG